MKKHQLLTIILLLMTLLACSKIFPKTPAEEPEKQNSKFVSDPTFFQTGTINDLQTKIDQAMSQISYNQTVCIGAEDLPTEYFAKLPSFPYDFYELKVLYDSGTLQELEDIPEQYWKQPCWLPNWNRFLDNVRNPPKDCAPTTELYNGTIIRGYVIIREPDGSQWRIPVETKIHNLHNNLILLEYENKTTNVNLNKSQVLLCAFRKGAYGYGINPGQSIINTFPGAKFQVLTRVYSGPIVETYQTLHFIPVYREHAQIESIYAFDNGAKTVNQDPKIAEKYIHVSINPKQLLLEPAYPVLEKGWAQEIKMKVEIDKELPCGYYVFGINIGPIPAAEYKKLVYEYKGRVVQAGMTSIDRPWYEAFLDVKC